MSNYNEVEAVVNSKTETLSENAAKVVVEPGKEIMPGKDVKSAAKRAPRKKAPGQADKDADKPPTPELPAPEKEAGGGSNGGEKDGSVGAQGAAGREEAKPSSTKEQRTSASDEGIHDDEPEEARFPVVPLSVDIENVYTAFVQQAKLFDEDREKLKKERGFTDATIDALRFRSCGEANRQVIESLRSTFGDRLMEQAGILVREDGALKPSFQLLQPNILIPYLGERGRVTFLRPHKLGLTGMGIRIYLPSQALKGTVIVTESEFKAAAAAQYGYPAIGLPGIHSFAATNFPKLVELIKSFPGIETLVVVFDSEIKNDPRLPNFKKNPITRWDTQWRSYQFADRLFHELKNVRTFVGELPAAWRVNGKIDIDGALAQGRTAGDFKAVVEGAPLPGRYLERLPREARRVLTPKIEEHLRSGPFREYGWGLFHVERKENKEGVIVEREVQVSDFTLRFVQARVRDGKRSIRVEFTNQHGEKHADLEEYTSDYTSLREFKKWVRGLDTYVWFGKEEHLDKLIQWQRNIMPPGEVRIPKGVGYLPKEGVTLYKNCLFLPDGTRHDADEKTGVIRPMIDGSDLDGYLAESSMEGDNADASLPTLGPTFPAHSDNDFLEQLRQGVDAAYRSSLHVRLALGWLIGCLYSREIFQKYKFFPLLGVFGKRESGKTTLCEMLMQAVGLNLKPFGIEKSTPVGVERLIAWNRSLPVVLDEFRNIRQIIEAWEGYLRGLFNRQPRVKGKKEEGKTSSYPVNAGVILAGEDAPMDNALFSRMVIINMRAVMHDAEKLADLLALPLSRLAEIVARRKQKLLPGILDDIGNFKKRLMTQGASSRVAESYAVPAACYLKFFLDRDVAAAKQFIQAVRDDAIEHNAEKEATHPVNQFWEELPRLKNQGRLDDAIEIYVEDGKKYLAIAMADVYAEYANALKGRETIQTKRTLLKRIGEEDYFVEKNVDMEIGVKRKQRSCLVVKLDHEKTPSAIKELASGEITTQVKAKQDEGNQTSLLVRCKTCPKQFPEAKMVPCTVCRALLCNGCVKWDKVESKGVTSETARCGGCAPTTPI